MDNTVGHIGLAVRDIKRFLESFCFAFSIPVPEIKDVGLRQIKVAVLNLKNVQIEVLEDYSHDGPIARIVRERGDTIHHFCMTCEDISKDMASLAAKGLRFIDFNPKKGVRGKNIAFISPEVFSGINVELSEP